MWNFARRLPNVILLVSLPLTLHAQNSTPSSTPGNPPPATPERAETGVYNGREIYVPKITDKDKDKDQEPAATSFADGFLRNTRQHIGASVGVTESYTPNLPVSDGTSSLSLTSVYPQLFLNFDTKKFAFRLNYGLAYQRTKEGTIDLSSASQNGSAALNYSVSGRKASLVFTNSASSMYFDQGSFLGMFLTSPYLNSSSFNVSQTYPDRQRLTRGTSGLGFTFHATKKTAFNAGLTYDVARYSGSHPQRADLLSGVVGISHSFNKWLSLNTSYNQNLYSAHQGLGTANMQNLQIANLSFNLRHGWTISGGGGITSTRTNGAREFAGSGLAVVSKKSRNTAVVFTYNRGYYTVFPASSVWAGDAANFAILHRLSSRLNFHADSSYIRGSAVATATSLAHSTYGSAGFDVLPQKNFVISTNYFLVSQKLLDLTYQQPNLHRHTISIGVTYYLPNLQPIKQ